MRFSAQTVFALVILVAGIWALAATRDWSLQTALYPRVIGVPLVILAAAEVIFSLRGKAEGDRQAIDTALSDSMPPAIANRRTLVAFAWLLWFFALVVLLGFPVAVPVFMLTYLRIQGREAWLLSIILAGIAWLGFYLVFDRLLHLPFAEGWLLRFLR